MNVPPSLAAHILQAAFRAANGELGILPKDADAFLSACSTDSLAVLGWEAWVVDHAWGSTATTPRPSPGSWCGVIPSAAGGRIIGGDSGRRGIAETWDAYVDRTVNETRGQLASFIVARDVGADWTTHLRLNFTLLEEADE